MLTLPKALPADLLSSSSATPRNSARSNHQSGTADGAPVEGLPVATGSNSLGRDPQKTAAGHPTGAMEGGCSFTSEAEESDHERIYASQGLGSVWERASRCSDQERLQQEMQMALRNEWLGLGGLGSRSASKRRLSKLSLHMASEGLFGMQPWVERLVKHPVFDNFCGLMIVLNALCLALQANNFAMHPDRRCHKLYSAFDLFFCIFFSVELLVRVLALKKKFFSSEDRYWNWFDSVVVFSSVLEEVLQRTVNGASCEETSRMGKGLTGLRILRICRIIRILRVVRVLHLFCELRVLLRSVVRCLIPLFWASIVLLVIQWCFSVYFVNISADFVASQLSDGARMDDKEIQTLHKYWGSFWQALYTLFLTVTGGIDWGDASDSLLVTGYHSMFLYIAYVALTTFAVLNVVTGVFVENARNTALHDRDVQVHEQLYSQRMYNKSLLKIFDEVDVDCDGRVSQEDLERHLGDEKVSAYLSSLGLTGVEARRLFKLLDVAEAGSVDAEEFVNGCMCLRGNAKTLDVVALMMEQKKIVEHLTKEFDLMKATTAANHSYGPRRPSISLKTSWCQTTEREL